MGLFWKWLRTLASYTDEDDMPLRSDHKICHHTFTKQTPCLSCFIENENKQLEYGKFVMKKQNCPFLNRNNWYPGKYKGEVIRPHNVAG